MMKPADECGADVHSWWLPFAFGTLRDRLYIAFYIVIGREVDIRVVARGRDICNLSLDAVEISPAE